jgi:hypothetical protein
MLHNIYLGLCRLIEKIKTKQKKELLWNGNVIGLYLAENLILASLLSTGLT